MRLLFRSFSPSVLFLSSLLLILSAAEGKRAQWYLTGNEVNQDRKFTSFPSYVGDNWKEVKEEREAANIRKKEAEVAEEGHVLEKREDAEKEDIRDEPDEKEQAGRLEEEMEEEKKPAVSHLSFGGGLAVLVEKNNTVVKHVEDFLCLVLMVKEDEQEEGERKMDIEVVLVYEIFVTKDYEQPYGLEIGLMHEYSREFSERRIHQLRLGKEFRIVVTTTGGAFGPVAEHHVIIAEDNRGRLSLTQHTWKQQPEQREEERGSSSSGGFNVRTMTYNIWHNNPPTWVVSSKQRSDWYSARIALLTKYITEQDPDIITFQEVRLDSTFSHDFPVGGESRSSSLEKAGRHGGSQLHHLLDALQQHLPPTTSSSSGISEEENCQDVLCKYQLVYQPAMSMFERNRPFERNEEGVAMLIRATSPFRDDSNHASSSGDVGGMFRLEINRVQPLFLARDMENQMDDHHRVILHAEVELIPSSRISSLENPILDIMTTHLSLSSPARAESMETLWKFVSTSKANQLEQSEDADNTATETKLFEGEVVENVEVSTTGEVLYSSTMNSRKTVASSLNGYTRGHIQLLTGDFNAEPHEPAYRFITGEEEAGGGKDAGTDVDAEQKPNFRDAWVLGGREENESDGFTFPSCNPVKRIDFILVRNVSACCEGKNAWSGKILRSERVGLLPTPESAHRVESRDGLGMLDLDSPIWASDHYAVVTDMWISNEGD